MVMMNARADQRKVECREEGEVLVTVHDHIVGTIVKVQDLQIMVNTGRIQEEQGTGARSDTDVSN